MVLAESLAAVDLARDGDGLVVPHPVWCFDAIPATIRRLLTGEPGGLPLRGIPEHVDRVALVLLDAFGWRFLERHQDHPFLRRLDDEGIIAKLTTQFPSTTTAHVTTVHSGLPVGLHGLYEWNVLDPRSGEIVIPLMQDAPDLPSPSFYQRLGAPATVRQPATFSPSGYDRAACTGAALKPYTGLRQGIDGLASALAAEPGYQFLYYDRIDAMGHLHGPDSREFDQTALRALQALHDAFAAPIRNAVLVVCADHGQIAVDPARVDDVDLVADGRLQLANAPAGSARDLFLHVAGDPSQVAGELAAALGERALVRTAAQLLDGGLFGARAGPRLHERLADVCVLPAPGRMAWLSTHPGVERVFQGHHGGMTPEEAHTFIGVLPLG